MKKIELTGKETKAQIIEKIIETKPYFEHKGSKWHNASDFKRYDKKPLLKIVKIINANIDGGGDGNLSEWYNEEAHSFIQKTNYFFKLYIEKRGIDKSIFKNESKEAMQEWNDYLATIHNFVGKDDVIPAYILQVKIFKKYYLKTK